MMHRLLLTTEPLPSHHQGSFLFLCGHIDGLI